MSQKFIFTISLNLVLIFAATCLYASEPVKVSLRGKQLTLMGKTLTVGQKLPNLTLPDNSLNEVKLASFKGRIAIVSVVPSLDTPTCEKQTHILSEENGGLDKSMSLITISRDLPFAQKRFSKNAKIENILFLSDYREAEFGKSSGLLMEENRLLARAVIILDKEGIIRYLEIVPELSELPDMKNAFDFARSIN
ncbi:MAG: thiol peroxidase [Nitrospinales bacterium]